MSKPKSMMLSAMFMTIMLLSSCGGSQPNYAVDTSAIAATPTAEALAEPEVLAATPSPEAVIVNAAAYWSDNGAEFNLMQYATDLGYVLLPYDGATTLRYYFKDEKYTLSVASLMPAAGDNATGFSVDFQESTRIPMIEVTCLFDDASKFQDDALITCTGLGHPIKERSLTALIALMARFTDYSKTDPFDGLGVPYSKLVYTTTGDEATGYRTTIDQIEIP